MLTWQPNFIAVPAMHTLTVSVVACPAAAAVSSSKQLDEAEEAVIVAELLLAYQRTCMNCLHTLAGCRRDMD